MAKNINSTRYFSNVQEEKVAGLLGGSKVINSGATKFLKGDVIVKEANLSIECKTVTSEKTNFSIKKEWLDKHEKESKECHYYNTALAITFSPNAKENYFIINEKLMKYLVEKLKEEI